jgi:hypothetical protein
MFILVDKRKNSLKITIEQLFFNCFFEIKPTCWHKTMLPVNISAWDKFAIFE